jgi:hypothetical protein
MTKSTASFHSISELSAADIELIENFVLGNKKTITAAQLRVEYSEKAMKLLDRRGRLIAMRKQVNEWQQKVLLNNQIEGYMSLLCATLERHDFLAARKSRHPDFVEYSRYQTPADLAEETMYLPEESLSDITKEITDLRTATQFITTPTMTIDPAPHPQTPKATIPDPAMKELMAAVKIKALKRLLDYVKNGEKVTITEVLKNGQDQTITTKTTEIKRTCPRWVIERIRGTAEF